MCKYMRQSVAVYQNWQELQFLKVLKTEDLAKKIKDLFQIIVTIKKVAQEAY